MKPFLPDSQPLDCALCHNARIVSKPDGYGPCVCVYRRRALQAYFATVVGQEFEDARLDNLAAQDAEQQKILSVAKRFVEAWSQPRDKRVGLYLWSARPGSGKTLIACAIANALAQPAQAIEANTYFNALRSCYDSHEPSTRYSNALMAVPVLVLDDLGVGMTDKTDEWLLDLLNARIQRRLCTIVTSNFSAPQIPHLQSRTLSRLAAHCHPIAVPDATDFRILLAKQKRMTL